MNMSVLKIPPINKQGKIKGDINTVVGLVRQSNPLKEELRNHSTAAWK
jgi:mRNA-degrading endonuclease YafQ of YafQ-DinJ toxin-antitoxin module